jgi:hypothetical protein
VELLAPLLTQSAAVLMAQGLVDLNRVAHDGMRVRASAGAASFRREQSLKACLEEARVSTPDADARVMKMGDGGFRPAYNAQLATDTKTQVIVGVAVTNSGSDLGQMPPMVEQIEERFERVPAEYWVDGGFAKKEDIEEVSTRTKPTAVYAPVQKPKKEDRDPHQPRPGDSVVVAAWRVRMGTAAAKEIYKERASTAECVNAQARNRGLRQFLVRGTTKVKAVLLWYALAHHLTRALALGVVWGRTS